MNIKESCIKASKKAAILLVLSIIILTLIQITNSQNLTEDSFEKFPDRNLELYPLSPNQNGEFTSQFPQIINSLVLSQFYDQANRRFFKRVSKERQNNPNYYLLALAGESFFRIYFGNVLDPNKPKLEFIEQFNTPYTITSLAFFPDDALIAYGDAHGNIIAWEIRGYKTDVKKGKKIQPKLGSLTRTQQSHRKKVTSVAFSNDGRYLVSGGADYLVKEWDIYRYQTTTLYKHSNIVSKVAMTKDNKFVVSSGYDKKILFYNKKTKNITTLKSTDPNNTINHTQWISDFAISPDGNSLVSVGYDRKVLLWDISDLNNVNVKLLGEHNTIIHTVCYSKDGNTIATAGADGTIILWRGEKKDRIIRNHDNVILGLAFSPQDELLFSSSNQGKIIIQKP